MGLNSQLRQALKKVKDHGGMRETANLISNSVIFSGFISVKSPPYNAKGDGVTDDTAAITAAMNDAVNRTLYFPGGSYVCGALTAPSTGPIQILGDGPTASVILVKANVVTFLTLQAAGSSIRNIGFTGPLTISTQPYNAAQAIVAQAIDGLVVDNIIMKQFAWTGIDFSHSKNVLIQNSEFITGGMCLIGGKNRKVRISGNRFHDLGQSGLIISGDGLIVENNHCYRAGPVGGFCIIDAGSTHVEVRGNTCSDMDGAMEISSENLLSATPNFGTACMVSNNTFARLSIDAITDLRGGMIYTNNTFTDVGYGWIPTNVDFFECTPGIVPDLANGGTNYQVGDILTLVGGTGTAAQIIVNGVQAGGALCTAAASGQNSLTYPITLGNYSVFPANSVSLTGGHGSGAKVIYTNAIINAAGTGYAVGDMLQGNPATGTFVFPVLVLITAVGGSGNVTGFEIVNGGAYTGTPPVTQDFVSYGAATGGTGFTITPSWGKRTSQTYGYAEAGGSTNSAIIIQGTGDDIIAGNHFANNASSAGVFPSVAAILFEDSSPPQPVSSPASHLIISNLFAGYAATTPKIIKRRTGANTFDSGWAGSITIVDNLGYP